MTAVTSESDATGARRAGGAVRVVASALSIARQRGRPWRRLQDALAEEGIAYDLLTTRSAGDAVALARECAVSGCGMVVAAGGDGTIGEVLSGLMAVPPEQRPALGILPLGRGNDFVRTLPCSLSDPRDIARRLKHGTEHALDVGHGYCSARDGASETELYFVNVASIGFAADVTKSVATYGRNVGGTWPYLRGLVSNLIRWKNRRARVQIDDVVHESTIFTVNVANGRHYGGGMYAAPRAEVDDGLFDVVVMEGLSLFEVGRYMPNNYSGKFDSIAKIKQVRGRSARLETETPMPVMLDGDVVGLTPARFEILPGAVRLVY